MNTPFRSSLYMISLLKNTTKIIYFSLYIGLHTPFTARLIIIKLLNCLKNCKKLYLYIYSFLNSGLQNLVISYVEKNELYLRG